jgi:AAHS family 4-hydroxybenzoate transporter-like MFS transporter
MTALDPRIMLEEAPMSRAQIIALALVCGLSALDGYDVLAVSFAAPGITKGWDLGRGALGLVLSSGLVGMAFGSIVVSPFADIIGRRRTVIVSLGFMAAGMLLSAFASSIESLAAWRVVTGIGIGAMVPVITPLAAEFANKRRRALALAILAIGFPLGGTVGGFAAALLLHFFAWPAVFLFGAGAALLLLPLVVVWLPEPLAFLLARRDGRSMERVNGLLARCNLPTIAELPPVAEKRAAPYRAIFGPGQRAGTLRITAVNLLYLMTVYYVLSWMPQMIADAGFSASAGTALSATASMSGAIICILISLAAPRIRLRALGAAMMIGLSVATAIFGYTPPSLILLAVMAALIGGFLYTGIFGLYATIVDTFEPGMRATGVGFVMGVGRGASALSPAIAGALFEFDAGRDIVSALIATLALAAGLLMLVRGREPGAAPAQAAERSSLL